MTNFFTNHYDILFKNPETEKEKLYAEEEELAKKLVYSGNLRISNDDRCNFIIYPVQNGKRHLSFSKRELFDDYLLLQIKEILAESLNYNEFVNVEEEVKTIINILQQRINKYTDIQEDFEIKIARLLVQSAHLAVISNLIDDNVKIFVSVQHNISDLLDIRMWQTSRYSQGMQSIDYKGAGIFISMGGNPFYDPKESNNEYDGFVARARLMIVAAQEIAHYADIIKDRNSNPLGRFSSRIDMVYPDRECNEYRVKALEKISCVERKLLDMKIKKVFDIERTLKIQRKYKKFSIRVGYYFVIMKLAQAFLKTKMISSGMVFWKMLKEKKFLAEEILTCLGDMKFNMEPKSSAYLNDDKNIEDAIACAEALARIPQQELKWGRGIVKYFCFDLQRFYYKKVVAAEIKRYEYINKKKFELPKTKYKKPILEKMLEK